MKFLNLRPILWVDDVRSTIDWYVLVLGFQEGNYSEEWQWGAVIRDEVEIMFAKPTQHSPYDGPKFTGSLYINTDHVETIWNRLKDSPFVYYGLETFEYGMKEFAIRDINGYILQFGQEVPSTT